MCWLLSTQTRRYGLHASWDEQTQGGNYTGDSSKETTEAYGIWEGGSKLRAMTYKSPLRAMPSAKMFDGTFVDLST